MSVIPFYGAEHPELFSIERKAMDRQGLLIEALRRRLPKEGSIVDVGAGDGFTAERLTTLGRRVVPLEPSPGMIQQHPHLPWVQGEAERLPFTDGAFGGAYATWAYFFSREWNPRLGLAELHRVVRRSGVLLIADNLGGDEFCRLAPDDITADPSFWESQGFACEPIETFFEFDNIEESRRLLQWFFGGRGSRGAKTRLSFRIGLFASQSRGPAPAVGY